MSEMFSCNVDHRGAECPWKRYPFTPEGGRAWLARRRHLQSVVRLTYRQRARRLLRLSGNPKFRMAAKRTVAGSLALGVGLIASRLLGLDQVSFFVAWFASFVAWSFIDVFVGRMPE